MRVGAGELAVAVHAEGVVPDHPISTNQTQFARGDPLQLRRVFVADREPERTPRPQHADDPLHPAFGPREVILVRAAIVVLVVVVADVERRIGEGQVHTVGLEPFEFRDAIPADDAVVFDGHRQPSLTNTDFQFPIPNCRSPSVG